MAITNLIENIAVARIADCKIKVYVAGTATTLLDIAEVTDTSAKVTWNTAKGAGYGATFAVSSKMSEADITFGSMCLSAALLSALTGGTPSTPSATTETSSYKVSDLTPYFSFEMQSTDITGLDVVDATNGLPADVHVRFPKCKITGIDGILPPVDGFATVKVTAIAIADATNELFSIVKNTTAAAIA